MNLRRYNESDRSFFYELFVATHQRIFAQMPLAPAQLEPLMKQQFESQWQRLMNGFSEEDYCVIEIDGEAVGQWFTGERDGQVEIVYAALMPAWQGQGLVAQLTRDLAKKTLAEGRRLRAFVECSNPARYIWYHLGFEVIEENGAHERIEYFDPERKYDDFRIRKVQLDDGPFLFELFCQMRADIFGAMEISPDQLESLQKQQFSLWNSGNARSYPQAKSFLVIRNGRRVGAWSYSDGEDGIYILNAGLVPEVRGVGISAKLHRALFRYADGEGKVVSSHVGIGNPAKEILEHLGLRVVGEAGAYHELMRLPSTEN